MTNQAKVVFSGEDKLSAVFAKVGASADKLGFNLDTLKGGAIGALGALAVPVSAGAIVTMANESRKAIDDLKDLSETVGTTVEQISAIDGLNREVGGSFDALSTALVKFNGILKDADPDKGAGAVLKALNLDIEELKRLDPVDAMQRVAVALGQWADDGNRARAVQELFGKSVKEVGPFLRDLAEAGKLNARITSEQAEEVDRFNKELARLQANAGDVSRTLTIDVVTALNRVIDKFREGQKEGKGFFATAAGIYTQNVADFYGTGQKGSRTSSGPILDPNDQSAAEMARLTRQAQRPSLNIPSTGPSTRKAGGAAAPKDPYAEANRYLESLRKQLQATEELTVYEKLLADIRNGSIGKLTPQLQAQLEATAKKIDADKELNAITKEFAELSEQAAKAQAELQEEARGFFEATRTPIERLNIELARQDELLRKLGPAYKDTYMRAQEAAQDRYEAEVKVEEKISELDQFTQRAAQNMQDYLGSSFQQIMEGNFDNIGDAFVSMLNNMVAQAAAAQLSKYLFGDLLTGKSGGGNGAIGDIIGSAASSLFGGFRAEGGAVQRGKGYIVGERGPEWFEPATSGTVVPNHALGGQALQVNNVFHLSGPVDRRTQQQIGAAAAQGAQRALARNT
jgi:hypothetical protein